MPELHHPPEHQAFEVEGEGMNKQKTKQAAYGKWGSILGHLGYGAVLDGKHQTCPACETKKKFRYTDYKSNGDWICTCGSGDGFDLIMQSEGLNFDQAAKMVDGIIGNNDLEEIFRPEIDYEKRRTNLNKVWASGKYFGLVQAYLSRRGIDDHGTGFKGLTDLRGCNELYDSETGRYAPGMIALIRNSKGQPVSIHRTYFDPKAKKIMPPTEKISGAGVRLGSPWDGDTLVVGEGIETTLAGMSTYRCPGLASISAHGMETLIVPPEFKKIIIMADRDRSMTGQKAAFTLGRRMDADKREVRVIMSSVPGQDYLDACRTGYDNDTLVWDNQ